MLLPDSCSRRAASCIRIRQFSLHHLALFSRVLELDGQLCKVDGKKTVLALCPDEAGQRVQFVTQGSEGGQSHHKAVVGASCHVYGTKIELELFQKLVFTNCVERNPGNLEVVVFM